MPFEIEPYRDNAAVGRVRICLKDNIDCSEAAAISQLCLHLTGRCRIFYLDLADMGEVSREMVACLCSYLRWGRETGVSVRIVNAAAHHLSALGTAGISEFGTAAAGERPCAGTDIDETRQSAADAVMSTTATHLPGTTPAGAQRPAKVCGRPLFPAHRKGAKRRSAEVRSRKTRALLRD